MKFEDLSPELKEQIKACKTPEEVLAFAKDSDEELSGISGGWGDGGDECSDYCYRLWSI